MIFKLILIRRKRRIFIKLWEIFTVKIIAVFMAIKLKMITFKQ